MIVDELLLYVTGGFAYARINHDFTVTDAARFLPLRPSARRAHVGLDRRFGRQWAWTNNISIKSEVLYVKFNDVLTGASARTGALRVSRVRFDNQDSMWVTRIGVAGEEAAATSSSRARRAAAAGSPSRLGKTLMEG